MHWRLEYYAKHAAQKALGSVPRGFVIQQLVKGVTRRWERVTAEPYVRSRLQVKVSRFNAARIGPPRVVVEQGTGALGLDLVLFHLAGASRVITYDTRPWLRPPLLRRNAEVAASATGIVKGWRGTDPARVDERAERLKPVLAGPWPALLEHLGVEIRVTRSMERPELAPGSVDLFYSDSVLQFVAPREMAALVRHARRFLGPSGRSFHFIDCVDLHARNDPRVPRLAYLAYPDFVWRSMTSKYLNYQNRLRMPEFAELFRREGLASRVGDPVACAEDVEYARTHLARNRRFKDMRPEEIATRSFWLTGIAPQGRQST